MDATKKSEPETQSDLRHQKLTIADVAEAAGVSKATVSQVLSGNRPVSKRTRGRVEEVIAKLGFQPSAVAQSLASNKSQTVALVVPDLTNPFYPTVARGLQEILGRNGYLTFVADSGAALATERGLLEDAIRRRVDGLVVAAFALQAPELLPLMRHGIPLVTIGTRLEEVQADLVSADDAQIAHDATSYLFSTGRKRLATISGPTSSTVGLRRLEGFQTTCRANGVKVTKRHIACGDWTRLGGYAAMNDLLSTARPLDGVFVANDLMAIGALAALREKGIRVPDDIAIIGVDDIDAASLVTPAISTIRIPAVEIGRTAGRLLLERMGSERIGPRRKVLVEHELIVREST